ncbi:hypothetical protein B0186_01275 [Canicola haemoglobinophilus]|uniref:Uncharacterized conserved protein n=1 Tax=Canicola haemoglobinophilus TaxID=733 RepID=A0A1V4B3U2_9PAST|nr:DUF262 domain-containing protein [Canicola haemoglobinophilus]OOS02021.1 hypothetical protein B0186_01275 [Canicola haemoglobinophilus]STO60475.1 Uncharacterized conserved protein [Canicola haemoglobinophilus]
MTELSAEITNVEDILKENLAIPEYQRAYKWTQRNVQQLLDDLWFHFNYKPNYRIGAVVLHEDEENKLNIVDGQQRIITLSLILFNLEKEIKTDKKLMSNGILVRLTLRHQISIDNIKNNNEVIKNFIQDISPEKKSDFYNYILKCEMVRICLKDIDKAFQFFDAQNARGKSLAPYDLLKAYHLREFEPDNPNVLQSVENWENAVDTQKGANLNKVISQTLFRLRRWDKLRGAEYFENEDIVDFKGVSQSCHYPYVRQALAGNAMHLSYKLNPFMFSEKFAQPIFQTNQVIINGQSFFEYIEHYRKSHDFLFHAEKGYLNRVYFGSEEKSLLAFLNSYHGNWRVGDQYVRNLFECVLLRYYDKFGLDEIERAITLCFRWAYRIRLIKTRVFFSTVENEANSINGLLFHINNSITPKDVFCFSIPKYKVEFQAQDLVDLEKLEVDQK